MRRESPYINAKPETRYYLFCAFWTWILHFEFWICLFFFAIVHHSFSRCGLEICICDANSILSVSNYIKKLISMRFQISIKDSVCVGQIISRLSLTQETTLKWRFVSFCVNKVLSSGFICDPKTAFQIFIDKCVFAKKSDIKFWYSVLRSLSVFSLWLATLQPVQLELLLPSQAVAVTITHQEVVTNIQLQLHTTQVF